MLTSFNWDIVGNLLLTFAAMAITYFLGHRKGFTNGFQQGWHKGFEDFRAKVLAGIGESRGGILARAINQVREKGL